MEKYLQGFANIFASESIKNTLPSKQNSPQHLENGLIAEQISGTAFTKSRATTLKSWLYKTHPSAIFNDFQLAKKTWNLTIRENQAPNPYRFKKPNIKKADNFIDGCLPIAKNSKNRIYHYQFDTLQKNHYMANLDGEFLFIPYQGILKVTTEFGQLTINPYEILVIPKGIYFSLEVKDSKTCGYLCENQGEPLVLPELGVLGTNALAYPEHFKYPVAIKPQKVKRSILLVKNSDKWWQTTSDISPINTVAWRGNYAPYKYNLLDFNTINTVSFDHPDPSIFTVLTSSSAISGIANLDFVIFPARWMVAENTFRPPYFHRNVMSEFMGLLQGQYDAKSAGFQQGGFSIHNPMIGHGPDFNSYDKAIKRDSLKPDRYKNTLAFMLESNDAWQIMENRFVNDCEDKNYGNAWQGF